MKKVCLISLLLLCCSVIGFGQIRQQKGGPPGQRVEQFKKLRMIEALKLDDDVAVPFFAKYNKHEEAMKDINNQRDGFIDQLQGMRKTSGSDAEIEKIAKQLIGLDGRVTEERSRFFEDMKSVLTMKQIADLIVFERNFARNLRQIMQEMTQERRQGMGQR